MNNEIMNIYQEENLIKGPYFLIKISTQSFWNYLLL